MVITHLHTTYKTSTERLLIKRLCLLCLFFQLFVLNGFGQECIINTVNPSFESLSIPPGVKYTFVCDHDHPDCGRPLSSPGWNTTESDHQVEIWNGTTDAGIPTTTVGFPGDFAAVNGNQFVELNANGVGALYQDFSTPYPTTFTVKFSHRGRGGTQGAGPDGTYDTATVYAGSAAVGNTLADIETLTPIKTVTDNNAAWGTYTTTYTVPAGQTTTRFAFASVAYASGDIAEGNFLDNIQFTANNTVNAPGPVALCTSDQATVTAGGIGTWTAYLTNPSTTTIALTPNDLNNTAIISGFAVAGTYQYYWITPYCTSTLSITVTNQNPVTPIINSNSPVCAGNNLTLSANEIPNATYQWIGPNGFFSTLRNPVVSTQANTNMSGSYTLTIFSPAGCPSPPAVVNVLVNPSNIIITPPNVFTPNGDEIEDTWKIDKLDKYPDCFVRIFNRWGTLIFFSRGYSKPWDGTYYNLDVPAGTYYYVIELNNCSPLLSGYVAVIR